MSRKKIALVCLIAVICLGALAAVLPLIRGTEFLGLLLVFAGTAGTVALIFKYPDRRLSYILLAALLLRLALVFSEAYITPLPDADTAKFERIGWQAALAWREGTPLPRLQGSHIYAAFIGVLYYLFGRVVLVPQFINAVLGVAVVFLVYLSCLELFKKRDYARTGALAAAIFPTLNLFSAILLREMIYIIFLLLSIYIFLKWVNRGWVELVALSSLILLVASAFHESAITLGAVYLLFFCFYSPAGKCWHINVRSLLGGAAAAAAVFVVFYHFLRSKLPSDIMLLVSPGYFGERLAIAARDRTVYLAGLIPETYFDLLWQTPLRLAYLLLAPFPWMVENMGDLFGFVDALLYGILLYYGIKTIRGLEGSQRTAAVAILLVVVILALTFAWGTSNYGTAIRHRQKFVPLLIILASPGILQGARRIGHFFSRRTRESGADEAC